MVNQEILKKFPVIETDRFVLRQLTEADIPKVFELQTDPRVSKFLSARKIKTQQDVIKYIAERKLFFEKKWGITWVFAAKETSEFLGLISYNAIDVTNHRAEVSGELHPNYWRGRMAQEGLISVVRFGFENLNLHSITAKTSPENRSTIAILKSLGFQKEGHLVDRLFNGTTYEDQYLYSLIKGNKNFEELVERTQKKYLVL